MVDGDPGVSELGRILLALVAQRVESAGDHQCRGQPGKILRQQRRNPRIGDVQTRAVDVHFPKPVHVVLGQQKPVTEQRTGAGEPPPVGDGIDQPLQRRQWVACIASLPGDHRGQTTAGTVAGDRDPTRIGAQLTGVLPGPAVGRVRVVDGGRGLVFGRQSVIHREHMHARITTDQPARSVMGVEVAKHESATVIEHHQWCGCATAGGPIVPARDHTGRAGNRHRPDSADAHIRLIQGAGEFAIAGAGRGDVIGGHQADHAQRALGGQHHLQGGVQGVAVDGDRPASREHPLDADRKAWNQLDAQPVTHDQGPLLDGPALRRAHRAC